MSGAEFYDHTTYPSTGATGSSSALRAELDLIETGFGKLCGLSGNANKLMKVNSGATAHTTSIISDDGSTATVSGALTITGALIASSLSLTSPLTVAQGGTGRATSTTAYGLLAAGTTATGAHQTLSAGATTDLLVGGGASALPVWTTATGTGAPVRADNPTLTTPTLGAATATSINKVALTAPATGSTLTIADGKTLTASNTLTLTATDGSTLAIGTGGTLGTAAYTATTAYEASGAIATHAALTATHGISGAIVGTTDSQALTNKTYNGNTISSGTGTLTLGAGSTLATSATNSITLTSTGATNVTLPTTGTLATIAGSETLTSKTLTSPVINGTVTTTGLTLPAFAMGGAISNASNHAANFGSGALTAGAGSFTNSSGLPLSTSTGTAAWAADMRIGGYGGAGRFYLSASNSTAQGVLLAGAEPTDNTGAASWATARGTSAAGVRFNGDTTYIYGNSGLTDGVAYTPTARVTISPTSTDVTGALSATGNITANTNAVIGQISAANASFANAALAFTYGNAALTQGSSGATTLNAASGQYLSLSINNTEVVGVTSTGQAVTGALSATGITSVTDTTDATSTTAASFKTAGGIASVKQIIAGTAVLGNFLTAIPAGGANTCGFKSTSTANFGVFFGSGTPTLTAAKGSLYLRSDGTTTNDRSYINTDGGTTWTAVTTVA